MLVLALVSLVLAALPAILVTVNLRSLISPVEQPVPGLVSILIPARNEAALIEGTVRAALASRAVAIEVLVGDDHSTDATAEIVRRLEREDARVRTVAVPNLCEGWSGKNNACVALSEAALGQRLLYIDADIRLEPGAAAALAAEAIRSGAALISGVPRQSMGSLGELLTVPAINFLLLGFLPIPLMRSRSDAALGAGCGQLMLISSEAYRATGGHGALRGALHDGLKLPRIMRRAGYRTDLVAGRDLAECRMYRGFAEAWAGFSKNAREGMATPRALPLWTLLLFGGQILPWLLVPAVIGLGSPTPVVATAFIALSVSAATRVAVCLACGEPLATIPLHPVTLATALAIQWAALIRQARGLAPDAWKGRTYPARSR